MHMGNRLSHASTKHKQHIHTPEEREQPKPWPDLLFPPYNSSSNFVLLHINHTRQD